MGMYQKCARTDVQNNLEESRPQAEPKTSKLRAISVLGCDRTIPKRELPFRIRFMGRKDLNLQTFATFRGGCGTIGVSSFSDLLQEAFHFALDQTQNHNSNE